ncbi:MAG: cytochrome c [Caldilineaceae bacterium]
MMRHMVIGVVLVFLVVMMLAPARLMAGGWTAVTLDEMPLNVKAGEPFTLGFMVRQHGVKPVDLNLNDAPVLVTFRQAQSGQQIQFEARKEGDVGHFVVEATLPTAAAWELEIRPGWFPATQVATVEVLPAAAHWANVDKTDLTAQVGAVGMIALVLFGGLVWLRKADATRRRWRAGLLGGLLMVAIVLSGWLWSTRQAAAQRHEVEQVALGKVLFQAKGCTACHVHDQAPNPSSSSLGPDLSHYAGQPEFLRRWLANPQAIKPATKMPNLQLSAAEIDALVQFLESDNDTTK